MVQGSHRFRRTRLPREDILASDEAYSAGCLAERRECHVLRESHEWTVRPLRLFESTFPCPGKSEAAARSCFFPLRTPQTQRFAPTPDCSAPAAALACTAAALHFSERKRTLHAQARSLAGVRATFFATMRGIV